MNTEEKAKAYDEALDRMKHVVVAPKNEKALQALKETIFPELAVSEDERTRRKLIEFILDVKRISEEGRSTWAVRKDDAEMCNAFLAYLEKQKDHFRDDTKKVEQKPAQTDDEKEYIRTIKSIISDFIRDKKPEDVAYYQRIYNWLDGRHIEQKPYEPKNWPTDKDNLTQEQKPAEKEITLNGFEKVLDSFLFDFVHSPIIDCEPKEYIKNHSAYLLKAAYKELNAQLKQDFFDAQQEGRREGYEAAMAEQNPAKWSEEDEKMIDTIVSVLGQYIDYKSESGTGSGYATPRYSKEIGWLKSLRPQPKKESIEEKIMNFFDAIGDCRFTQADILKLKSIWKECELPSPQLRWKPSEEQVRSLEYFIKLWGDSDGQLKYVKIFNDVKSLCEQLKNL